MAKKYKKKSRKMAKKASAGYKAPKAMKAAGKPAILSIARAPKSPPNVKVGKMQITIFGRTITINRRGSALHKLKGKSYR